MPPQNQNPGPPAQYGVSPTPQPDYSFMNEQPKKSFKLPFSSGSLVARIIAIAVVGLVVVILLIVIKGFLTTSPFSKADYLLVTKRQQEMLHILTVDINNNNVSQLTESDQNFVATATGVLTSAQSKTLQYMKESKDKVTSKVLAAAIDKSVDNDLTSAQSANNLDGEFKSQMQSQLTLYEQNIKSAYNSTKVAGGRQLLAAEYAEAKKLLVALSSTTS